MGATARGQREEASEDGYGEEISAILFGTPPWFIRHGASIAGALLIIAIGASWFVSYPGYSHWPISFRERAGGFSGSSTVAASVAEEFHVGQVVSVELTSARVAKWTRLDLEIETITPLAQSDKVTVEFVLRRSVRESSFISPGHPSTMRIARDSEGRLFSSLFGTVQRKQ